LLRLRGQRQLVLACVDGCAWLDAPGATAQAQVIDLETIGPVMKRLAINDQPMKKAGASRRPL